MYTVVTHDGRFHADDVFGVAVLQLRFGEKELNIIRTREQAVIEAADIVLDVGLVYDAAKLRFDHHQNGAPVRENGIPYAAFGLVWKEYGEQITGSDSIAAKIDKKLAQPIDAGDNGVSLYSLNEYAVAPTELFDFIESFLPPLGSGQNPNEAFLEAVQVARGYLERVIERAKIKEQLRAEATRVYEAAEDKSVLVFDTPTKRNIFVDYEGVLAVVSPDEEKTRWGAATIPAGEATFASRAYFPESWAGLRDEELAAVSGIPDAIFCHKGRFLFIAKSREGAERAAREVR
jgi:uncharacterized UPF0160 family protein